MKNRLPHSILLASLLLVSALGWAIYLGLRSDDSDHEDLAGGQVIEPHQSVHRSKIPRIAPLPREIRNSLLASGDNAELRATTLDRLREMDSHRLLNALDSFGINDWKDFNAVSLLLIALAEQDPQAALGRAFSAADTSLRKRLLETIVPTCTATDPLASFDWFAQHMGPNGENMKPGELSHISGLLTEIGVKSDTNQALAKFRELEFEEGSFGVIYATEKFFEHLPSGVDYPMVLESLREHPNYGFIHNRVVPAWFRNDRESALSWAEGIAEPENKVMAAQEIVQYWEAVDSSSALKWYRAVTGHDYPHSTTRVRE